MTDDTRNSGQRPPIPFDFDAAVHAADGRTPAEQEAELARVREIEAGLAARDEGQQLLEQGQLRAARRLLLAAVALDALGADEALAEVEAAMADSHVSTLLETSGTPSPGHRVSEPAGPSEHTGARFTSIASEHFSTDYPEFTASPDAAANASQTSTPNLLRIFQVDDQEWWAEALGAELSAVEGLLMVGRSSTTDPGLVDAVARSRPHVITVDIQPVGPATATLLGRLGAAAPDARIVVLTDSHDPAQAVDAARWGATAWVGKDTPTEHLASVLRGVCASNAYFSPRLLGFVLAELRADVQRMRDSSGPLDVLSARERDVLLGIVEGKRGSQIAAELFLSVNTVRTHTHNIFRKLKVHSRLEAASLARAAGMAPGHGGRQPQSVRHGGNYRKETDD